MLTPDVISEIMALRVVRQNLVLQVLGDSNDCRRRIKLGGDTYILDLDGAVPTVKLLPDTEAELLQPTGLRQAYEKVAAQMRRANIGEDYPQLEEPVSESNFVYPTDKVIDIRKGRKLRKRG